MKYTCVVISVADINAARKFYEDLFGLEVYQDYGRNIAFTCGLALQQDFDWLVNIPKEKVFWNVYGRSVRENGCFRPGFDKVIKWLNQYLVRRQFL